VGYFQEWSIAMKADANKINRLLKIARGQLDGILKMVGQDQYCMDISHQILSCQAVLKKANTEIIRAHMGGCVQDAFAAKAPEEASRKAEELTDLIDRLFK
jgi:DNA-binding FrmR family transcriptional regulator